MKTPKSTPRRKAAGIKAAVTRKRRLAAAKAAVTRKRHAAGKKAARTRKRKGAARAAAATRKRRAAELPAASKQQARDGCLQKEIILKLGCSSGSLTVFLAKDTVGAQRFVVEKNETDMLALLGIDDDDDDEEENDQDRIWNGEWDCGDTLLDALRFMDTYSWHRMTPLEVHPSYAESVMAEVSRLGETDDVQRWQRYRVGRGGK